MNKRLEYIANIVFNDFKEGNEDRILRVEPLNENLFKVSFGAGDAESLKGIKLKAGYQFDGETQNLENNGEFTKVITVKMTGAKRGKTLIDVSKAFSAAGVADGAEKEQAEVAAKTEETHEQPVSVTVPTAEQEEMDAKKAVESEQTADAKAEEPPKVESEGGKEESLGGFIERAFKELSYDMPPDESKRICDFTWKRLVHIYGQEAVYEYAKKNEKYANFINGLCRNATGEALFKTETEEPKKEHGIDAEKPVSPSVGHESEKKDEKPVEKDSEELAAEPDPIQKFDAFMKEGVFLEQEYPCGRSMGIIMKIVFMLTHFNDAEGFMAFVKSMGEEESDHFQILMKTGAITVKDEFKKMFFDYAEKQKWGIIQYVDAPTKGDLEMREEWVAKGNKREDNPHDPLHLKDEIMKKEDEPKVAVEQIPNHDDVRNFEDEDREAVRPRQAPAERTLKEKLNSCRSFLPRSESSMTPDGEEVW